MTDKQKAILHSIALKHHTRDEVAKLIVEAPFLFMKKRIEELNLEELDKINFYHKGLGRFYLKEQVLKKIKEKTKKNGKAKKS